VVRSVMQLLVSKLPTFKLSTILSSRANSCLASVVIAGKSVAPRIAF
jgi:hypothetical protein